MKNGHGRWLWNTIQWMWEGRGVPNNNNFYDLFFIIIFFRKTWLPHFYVWHFWSVFRPFVDDRNDFKDSCEIGKEILRTKSAAKNELKTFFVMFLCVRKMPRVASTDKRDKMHFNEHFSSSKNSWDKNNGDFNWKWCFVINAEHRNW